MQKRLLLNIVLQYSDIFDYSILNSLKLNNSKLSYYSLMINKNSIQTGKFLFSAKHLIEHFNLPYTTASKINKTNFKFDFSVEFNFLDYLSNIINNKRILFMISQKSVLKDLIFTDNKDFNFVTKLSIHQKNFNIFGDFIELTQLLKDEGQTDYNLGDWNVLVKCLLSINYNSLIYLLQFNLNEK